jgi:hypothetical protein
MLALAACGKAPPLPRGSLRTAFDALPHSPPCSQNLPQDWVSSWPVPGDTPGEFKVLFYALDRRAQDASGLPRVRVTDPRGHAEFFTDGRVEECTSNPVDLVPLDGERYPDAAMDMEEDEFDAATAKLLTLTEAVGAAYSRKTKADTRALAAFWKQFDALAEPALRARYYELNPKFWEWLRRENGASLEPGA